MYTIIACGIFKDEIERLSADLGFPFKARYLGPGLHVDFDELKDALEEELKRASSDGSQGIIVAYGQCHPKIDEILKPYHAALMDCQNCVDAFISRQAVEKKARDGLFFYLSPGWLDAWKDIFKRLGWDPEIARLHMGSFKGSVYIDTMKDAQEREEELLEFFDFTNLPFTIMPMELDHFKSLIIKAIKSLED
jgi:hypothetical protein